MALNVNAVLKDMMTAAATSFGSDWDEVKNVAEIEFKTILTRISNIGKAVLDPNNSITQAKAKYLVAAQIDLAAQAIVAFTAMTIIAVQKAINSALKVVRNAVNTAIGLVLI
ncbi:MAG: hypothetical protein RH982_10495 [Parvibaculum sp.]